MLRHASPFAATAGSTRGTASLELAIVAPVLLMMVLGISDLAMTTLAKFKSGNATATGADLATQAANLQTADMSDVFAGAMNVMAPLGTSTLALRITNVASNGNGSAFVYWSCGMGALPPLVARSGFSTLANGDSVGNAMNLYTFDGGGFTYAGTDTSLVQIESQYAYTPPTGFLLRGPQAMAANYVAFPRQAGYVGFPWDGVTSHPPPAPSATTRAGTSTLANGVTCSYAY